MHPARLALQTSALATRIPQLQDFGDGAPVPAQRSYLRKSVEGLLFAEILYASQDGNGFASAADPYFRPTFDGIE